ICGILLIASPASSQRSFSATYDSGRQVRLQGAVTRIDWVNPHAFLFINVRDAAGTVANWAVEFGNPLELERDGWKRSSLHIADTVTSEGNRARGDPRKAFAKSVVLTRTGKRLFAPATPSAAATVRPPTPRWPGGQIRLGPEPGKKGYWGKPSAKAL